MKRSAFSITILAATVLVMAIPGVLQGQQLVLSGGPALRGFGRNIPNANDRWSQDGGFVGAQLLIPASRQLAWSAGIHTSWGHTENWTIVCLAILPCPPSDQKAINSAVLQARSGLTLMGDHFQLTAGPALILVPNATGSNLTGGAFASAVVFPWKSGFLGSLGLTGDATRLAQTTGGVDWILAPGIALRF